MRLTGYEAIEAKEQNDAVVLNKYNDPTEAARENISAEDARQVAKQDASLIWAAVASHTPGPWKVDGTSIVSNLGPTIVHKEGLLWQFGEGEANARLIAAAPELLEACRRNLAVSSCDGLVCKSNGGGDYCPWCDTLAAIDKATKGTL